MIDVSIILVNYNGLALTEACIDSIVASEGGLSYEIIVVDNGSEDGSVEVLSQDSRITFIPMGRNAGFGFANNEGLKVASGRNVLFLNNDTVVLAGAVGKLSSFLDSHPRAGAAGGNLLAPASEETVTLSSGRDFSSASNKDAGLRSAEPAGTPVTGRDFSSAPAGECFPGRTPALVEAVSMSLSFLSVQEEIRGFFDIRPVTFNKTGREMEVAVISGADLMVRKSVLDAVGGFNPEFFMYYEDVELCWRIRKAGYSIWSLPSVEIIHIGGASSVPAEDDPYNIRRLRRKFDSRRKFYLLCRNRFHLFVSNLIWRLKVDTRILIHLFNPKLRGKWLSYRRNLK